MPAWRPLISGRDATRAAEAVEAIATALADPRRVWRHRPHPDEHHDQVSLAGGAAGIALFQSYVSAWQGNGNEAVADAWLAHARQGLADLPLPPGLHSGFSGIGWAHAHVDALGSSSVATDLSAIDEALLDVLSANVGDEYELIHGLAGYGVYALERLPSRAGVRLLTLVLGRLARCAERRRGLVTWHSPAHSIAAAEPGTYRQGHYNLGVAHGMPGVAALLGAACGAGFGAAAMPLLEGAVDWLWRQRLPPPSRSVFPTLCVPGETPEASRLAWCYGDAGIAAALLIAARGAKRADWRARALEVARHASRRSAASSGARDAGLCHGAAGLGHVFNRLFQATGDEVCGDAARVWFRRTLRMRTPGKGVAGFRSWRPSSDGRLKLQRDPGLLTGAAGTGLALLAAISGREPAWDRCLLMSARASRHGARAG